MPTTVFGDKLRDQVDDRLVYYEERKHQPMTNVKAMESALSAFGKDLKKHAKKESASAEGSPKKVKKDKKRKVCHSPPFCSSACSSAITMVNELCAYSVNPQTARVYEREAQSAFKFLHISDVNHEMDVGLPGTAGHCTKGTYPVVYS